MKIKVLDVLYDDQVCNLIYLQDITQVYQEQEREQIRTNILRANQFTAQGLKGPQQTILLLTKNMIETCKVGKDLEALEAIQYSTNLMHLHVQNLTDFQSMKYDALVITEKVVNITDSIQHAISLLRVAAINNGLELIHRQKELIGEAGGAQLSVATDGERVVQILQNVLRQAIMLAKQNSGIFIKCRSMMKNK